MNALVGLTVVAILQIALSGALAWMTHLERRVNRAERKELLDRIQAPEAAATRASFEAFPVPTHDAEPTFEPVPFMDDLALLEN